MFMATTQYISRYLTTKWKFLFTRFILKNFKTNITTHYITEKTMGTSLISIHNECPKEN